MMDTIELALHSKGEYQGFTVWYLAPTHEGKDVALMRVGQDSFIVKRAGVDKDEFDQELAKTAATIRSRCKTFGAVEVDIRIQHGHHVKVVA